MTRRNRPNVVPLLIHDEDFSPSAITSELYRALDVWDGDPFSTAVATFFTTEPGGKTLADVALDAGLWSPIEAK